MSLYRIQVVEVQTRSIHRSPLSTGCRFAWIVFVFGFILTACSPSAPAAAQQAPLTNNSSADPTLAPGIDRMAAPTGESVFTYPERIDPPESTPNKKTFLVGTPVPTMTPLPAPTETPSSRPVLPTSDLLFISDNRLIRWDHMTHYGVSLAENVVEFSVDSAGKTVAMLRTRGVAANGTELFDLELLDFETKHIQQILGETPGIKGIVISPDGNWLAFRQSVKMKIVAIRISDPSDWIGLGDSTAKDVEGCDNLAWSPDSKSILWCDQADIWIAYVDKRSGNKLYSGVTNVLDPAGNPVDVKASYGKLQWSPAGRFALVKVFPEGSGVWWQAVLDTRTGHMVQVVDSYGVQDTDASLTWLPGGTLAVAHASDPQRSAPPTIQIWNVVPTNPDLLISRQLLSLEPHRMFAGLTLRDISDEDIQWLCMEWLQPASANHLLVGTRIVDTEQEPVLFDLNLANGSFLPVSQLSQTTDQILWAPDGSGFLMLTSEGRAAFISSESGEEADLSPYSGTNIHSFIWLPPKSRR